jgi:hypothetical protein
MSALITCRQTTFWDFIDAQRVSRVHFKGKKEFHVAENEVPSIEVVREHPLLIDYIEAHTSIYLAGASSEASAILGDIQDALNAATSGWRDAGGYLNTSASCAVLTSGYGKLFEGPGSLGKLVSAVLSKAQLDHTVLPGRAAQGPMKVLVAGGNWIVAEDFRSEELSSNISLVRTRD